MKETTQRNLVLELDNNLAAIKRVYQLALTPSRGWLRTVREAIGLSQTGAAIRADIKQQAFAQFETRETKATITLESLQWAASALDCEVVYFLIPKREVAESFAELATRHDQSRARPRVTEHTIVSEHRTAGDLPVELL